MGDAKWTKEQELVINLRDRNILVSAAAGSGKTAVLVERIIQIISDRKLLPIYDESNSHRLYPFICLICS